MNEEPTMSKELTKKQEEKALAAYGAGVVETHDELDKDSYAIPRIALIEKLSPELEEDAPEFLPDAKPGLLVNKVMGEVYPGPILVIPVLRRRVYLEWVPRSQGGGFVAEHNVTDGAELMKQTQRSEKNYDILPSGNELHNVLEFYILASSDEGETWEPAILSMSRTRMAEGKKWNMRIDAFSRGGTKITPLAQVYELGTAKRDNPEGVSYVYKVGAGQFLPEVVANDALVFQQAHDFLEAVKSGQAQVNRDEEAGAAVAGTEEEF
jgi:hypothetical protein